MKTSYHAVLRAVSVGDKVVWYPGHHVLVVKVRPPILMRRAENRVHRKVYPGVPVARVVEAPYRSAIDDGKKLHSEANTQYRDILHL